MKAYIFCAFLLIPATSNALPGILGPVGDLTAGAVLQKAQQVGDGLIQSAQNGGNAMISHAGTEMDILVQNANLALKDNLNTQVKNLGTDEANILASVAQAEQELQQENAQVYHFKDTTIVDLARWQSNWIFSRVPEFFLQGVYNTSLRQSQGHYEITLVAMGFGISADNRADVTNVKIGGQPIAIDRIDQSHAGQAILDIAPSQIDHFFSAASLVILPMSLDVGISHKPWYSLGGWTKPNHYSVPIYITFYPKKVASISVSYSTPKSAWVSVGTKQGTEVWSPNKDGCRNSDCQADNIAELKVTGAISGPPVLGYERIVSQTLECTSHVSECNFVGALVWSVQDNQTDVIAHFRTWSKAVKWAIDGVIEEYETVGTNPATQNLDLMADSAAPISVPSDATLFMVTVKAFTGQTYTFAVPGSDPNQIVGAQLIGVGTPDVHLVFSPAPISQIDNL